MARVKTGRGSKIVARVLWEAMENFWCFFPARWEGNSTLLCTVQNIIATAAFDAQKRLVP